MKARILAGIIITGVLATSAAAVTTLPSDGFKSDFNTTATPQHAASQPCKARTVKNDLDLQDAPYHWKNQPKSTHFTPINQNYDFVC